MVYHYHLMCSFDSKFLLISLCFLCTSPAAAQRDLAGTAEIEQTLRNLNVAGSALMIGAHPDDENTAVLAYLARGRHVRTAYLSLTRGEGGQNLIGPEQGDLLGVIRTQELLAARRIDGAQQFFTRAIDFGYTKTPEETLAKWGHDRILSDVVWTIRRFRPDIIILRFSGTARDGHGQHQVSAMLGKEAFSAAADPKRFPEQLRNVGTWQARRLLWNVFRFTKEQEEEAQRMKNRIEIDVGDYNPILGKSYAEIAGISRSMHRSQGMGAPERRGSSAESFVTIAGESAQKDLFDGIDLTWNRVPGGGEIARLLTHAIDHLNPSHPEYAISDLLAARAIAKERISEFDEAIAQCAGLWLDAAADRYSVTPGEKVNVKLTAVARSRYHIENVAATVTGTGTDAPAVLSSGPLAYNQPVNASVGIPIPPDQPYSQPFWLAKPKQGDTYTIDDQQMIGVPDSPPVLEARFRLIAGGKPIELRRPVRYRYVDRVYGELIRPLTVAPPVAVNLTENVRMFPRAEERAIHVLVQANRADTTGEVHLKLPAGWKVQPAAQPFQLHAADEQQELMFEVTPPSAAATVDMEAVAQVGGRGIDRGITVISYPHIPVQTLFPPAREKLVHADIRNLAKRVGYIVGAGDDMPRALEQMGCEVTLLSPADLEQRNLADFDAIVAGVRAYNVRADLVANEHRLMDYVRNGGTYIVQYNTVDRGKLPPMGPYPYTVTMDYQQRNDRVTVEDAPVAFPNPANPLLHRPNEITKHDFDGWVQERGLYFASKWDSRYQPVLESHDPGAPPAEGGMLYARYGKGVYIFSAYAWFRQLPAGVPGAYRIFANMLSAGLADRVK
jgi:LmbE family N-acetylglucosaminyl deacetylase